MHAGKLVSSHLTRQNHHWCSQDGDWRGREQGLEKCATIGFRTLLTGETAGKLLAVYRYFARSFTTLWRILHTSSSAGAII